MRKLGRFFLKELKLVLPPTLFFFVGFNLIILTQRLAVANYLVEVAGFLVATTAALVVGKAVLVANELPFLDRFDKAPLIQPILFKTFVYWVVVFIARLLEALVHYIIEERHVIGFLDQTIGQFSWNRFLFVQIWILVLFLIYTTASELNTLFGDGELFRLLFTRRSSEIKQTRRQRIRVLVRLARLTGRHTAAEFADPKGAPFTEAMALISRLAKDGKATPAALSRDATATSLPNDLHSRIR